MANLVLDYLITEARDRSQRAIDFPAEYAECYAFLQSSVYFAPGRFYDQTNVIPWLPKGFVKTNNVQVNHITARGENVVCVALMNACEREFRDVIVKLDLPGGRYSATVWRDNQRETEKLAVIDGTATVSLSPKGITALVIEGLKVRAPFQDKFQSLIPSELPSQLQGRSPEKVITHQRIQTPFGEAQAAVLSFGPELTWLYAYLAAEPGSVKSAKLQVKLAGRQVVVTDESFPFEFSVPLKPTDRLNSLLFEAINADDERQQAPETHFMPTASRD
jgi:hypothetical protein